MVVFANSQESWWKRRQNHRVIVNYFVFFDLRALLFQFLRERLRGVDLRVQDSLTAWKMNVQKHEKEKKNEKFVLNFVNYSIFFLFENFEWGTFQQKFLNICLSICLFRATYGCQSESQTFSLDKTTEDFHGIGGDDTIFPF